MVTRRLVIGISGSSAPIYGIRLLEVLKDLPGIETHLVLSAAAEQTIRLETDWTADRVRGLADRVHDCNDLAAPISSGSFPTNGMIIAPCSMKTLSAVAHSLSTDLLTRAADVTLKEGRRLVVVPRETPLHLGHLRNMTALAEIGGVILPPMPAFYHKPATVQDLVDHTVGKILDQFHIEHALFRRWDGAPTP